RRGCIRAGVSWCRPSPCPSRAGPIWLFTAAACWGRKGCHLQLASCFSGTLSDAKNVSTPPRNAISLAQRNCRGKTMPQDAAAIRSILSLAPVVPVIILDDVSKARPLAEALVAGGLPALEVTLRTPNAL